LFFLKGHGMMAVTREQILNAQVDTMNLALDMLARVAALGESTQFSLRQSSQELLCSGKAKPEDVLEIRIKAGDFRGLIDVLVDVSEFLEGIVSFDSVEDVAAGFSERPAANRPRTKEDEGR